MPGRDRSAGISGPIEPPVREDRLISLIIKHYEEERYGYCREIQKIREYGHGGEGAARSY